MRTMLSAAVAAAMTAGLLAAVPAPAQLDRWVVSFEDELPADLAGLVHELGAVDGVALHALDVLVVTAPTASIEQLTARPDVRAVHPERRLAFHLASSVPWIGAGQDELGTPRPLGEGVERPAVDGTGVTVAVVDTGVWAQHPDLSDRVVASLDFELGYAGELLLTTEQLDTFAATTGPLAGTTDDVGHGTHVAGIVAGTGAASAGKANDNAGVAPGAAIVDLRISPQAHTTDNNLGWERNALAAYDWLLRHHADTAFGPHGIGVVNNSWGTGDSTTSGEPLDYDPFDGMLTTLDAEGVSVVFSAGNSGASDNVTEDLLPTGHPAVLTVAAGCHPGARSSGCNRGLPDFTIASFSSRGPAVDVTAPGVDILSAVNVSSGKALGSISGDYTGAGGATDTAQNRAWYANFSGTSMSGPHAAGLVALMLEVSPTLTPAEVRFLITATARDLLTPGRDIGAGYGMVDAGAVLDAAAKHAAGASVHDLFPDHTFETSL